MYIYIYIYICIYILIYSHHIVITKSCFLLSLVKHILQKGRRQEKNHCLSLLETLVHPKVARALERNQYTY